MVTVRTISIIRNSWLRYREKKNGQPDTVSSVTTATDTAPKPRLRDRIFAVVTHDTVLLLLSAAVPLILAILYSANIAQTSPVGGAQDELDMTYMLFVLPLGYLASGSLCALANKPSILFADEPTGNLDGKSGREVLSLLKYVSKEFGITLILVTHDLNVAEQAERIITIEDGKIVRDTKAGV